ncbi:hypothetical protein APSETT445_008517 [Aspergillus pseudonomiae]
MEHDPFNVDIIEGDKSTIVGLADETHKATFADGKTYVLPKNVRANIGNRRTAVHSLKVKSGDELARDLDASASLSGSYAGFSASTSAQYSYASSLSSTNYYAVLSVDHTSFTLALEGHGESDSRINPDLVHAVKQLPGWSLTQEVHDKYVRFFRSWGTHYIKSCTFGARFQLKIENHASEAQSKENFEVNVGAEYNGVAKVKGDVSVKGGNEYKHYLKTRQFQTKVYGGSSGSSLILGNAPDDPEKYQEAFNDWANSLNDAVASNLINVKIDSIGNLLSNSEVQEHKDIADKLVNALDFLASKQLIEGFLKVSLPRDSPSRTHVRELSIQGAPGVLIRENPRVQSQLRIEIVMREEDPSFDKISVLPIRVALRSTSASKSQIHLFYSGLDDTKWMEERRKKGTIIIAEVVIDAVIPLTILAPPTPLTVELSNLTSQSLTNTDLDLSPCGPKLHLAEGETKQTFQVDSLFLPGFGSGESQTGACFIKN